MRVGSPKLFPVAALPVAERSIEIGATAADEWDLERTLLPESLAHAVPKRKREFVLARLCAYYVLRHLGAGDAVVGIDADRGHCGPPAS